MEFVQQLFALSGWPAAGQGDEQFGTAGGQVNGRPASVALWRWDDDEIAAAQRRGCRGRSLHAAQAACTRATSTPGEKGLVM